MATKKESAVPEPEGMMIPDPDLTELRAMDITAELDDLFKQVRDLSLINTDQIVQELGDHMDKAEQLARIRAEVIGREKTLKELEEVLESTIKMRIRNRPQKNAEVDWKSAIGLDPQLQEIRCQLIVVEAAKAYTENICKRFDDRSVLLAVLKQHMNLEASVR